jgi:hypothetical protein
MDKTPKVPPADCRRTPAPRARSRQACRSTDLPHPRRRSGRSPQIGLDRSQPSAVRQCGLGLEQKPAALDGVLDGGSEGTEGRAMLALDLRHKGMHERAHGSRRFWRSGVLVSISVVCLRPSAIAAAGILEWQSRGTLGHARRGPDGNSAAAVCARPMPAALASAPFRERHYVQWPSQSRMHRGAAPRRLGKISATDQSLTDDSSSGLPCI